MHTQQHAPPTASMTQTHMVGEIKSLYTQCNVATCDKYPLYYDNSYEVVGEATFP